MWRALAVFLSLCLIAWCEFAYFPGHSYLQSSSQLYVAALEHLQYPAYLSRDLVATHPDFGLTAYDEVTLFLTHLTRIDLQHILLAELLLARTLGLFGLFLLARAFQLKPYHAVLVAALLSFGTWLPGPAIWLFDPEPVPRALAFGPLLLSIGLLGRAQNLLAAFFAGCAFLLDPVFATPLWLALTLLYLFDRKLRPALRPLAPVLLVFVLLLANLAQLQQGTPDPRLQLTSLPPSIIKILRFRSPELWLDLWLSRYIYLYFAIVTVQIWAVTRLWPLLTRQLRELLLTISLLGTLAIPASYLFVDHLHLPVFIAAAPLQLLGIPLVLMWISCAGAAFRAWYIRRIVECVAWAAPVMLVLLLSVGHTYRADHMPDTESLAQWAQVNTWGSSVFLFPDSPKSNTASRFRAQSLRPLWVDWTSGELLHRDPALAPEWFMRWRSTMEGPLDGAHLQSMLSLPIDYFVFNRKLTLEGRTAEETNPIKPIFRDDNFAVYEASTLRLVPGTLLIDGR